MKPLFHTRLGEVVQLKRDRWTHLGKTPGLSENGVKSGLCVLFEMVWLIFHNYGNYRHVFVVFGLEGLSP